MRLGVSPDLTVCVRLDTEVTAWLVETGLAVFTRAELALCAMEPTGSVLAETAGAGAWLVTI